MKTLWLLLLLLFAVSAYPQAYIYNPVEKSDRCEHGDYLITVRYTEDLCAFVLTGSGLGMNESSRGRGTFSVFNREGCLDSGWAEYERVGQPFEDYFSGWSATECDRLIYAAYGNPRETVIAGGKMYRRSVWEEMEKERIAEARKTRIKELEGKIKNLLAGREEDWLPVSQWGRLLYCDTTMTTRIWIVDSLHVLVTGGDSLKPIINIIKEKK